jgi:N-formylglutamate amidohydrolase
VHALQLEIAQRGYMDESTLAYDEDKAEGLQGQIAAMLDAMLSSAAARHA